MPASRHKIAALWALGSRTAEDLPKHVERYVEEGKEQGLEEGEAWAVAWSRYCKYKFPGSPRCKKESPSDYLPNQGKKAAASHTYKIENPYAYKKRDKSVWSSGVQQKMGDLEDFFSVGDKLLAYPGGGFSSAVFGKRGAYMVVKGEKLRSGTPVQITSLDGSRLKVRVLGAPKVKTPKPRAPRKPSGPIGKADPLSKRQWAAVLNAMRRGYDNSYAMMVDDAYKPFQRASKKYGLGDYYDVEVFSYLFGKVRRFDGKLGDREVEMLNEMKASEA